MNAHPRIVSAFAAVLFAVLPSPHPAQAATGIRQCVAGDGSLLFTDQPCGAVGARARPMPSGLETRLRATGNVTHPRPFDPPAAGAEGAGLPGAAVARRALTGGCAGSTAQLAMDLRAAIELGDVNRLAESYHWTGLDHARAQGIMRRLEALARQPLRALDAHAGGATLYADASARPPPDAAARRLQLRFDGPGQPLVGFDVEHYNGCYFVRF